MVVDLGDNILDIRNKAKRTIKNSLFCDIFKNPGNFIDLYKECSGKVLNLKDVTRFDLNSKHLSRSLNNDVSYLTNDNRLLIFVEHQSTVNLNMTIRLLLYFVEAVRIWLTIHGFELSARTKVHVPMPEFYVAYNGSLPYNESALTLSNDFLNIKVKLKPLLTC